MIDIFKRHKKWQFQNRSKDWQNHDMVISYKNGNPVRPDDFSSNFRNMLELYDLPTMRFHDLRHFNATMMPKSGISDKIAARRLGHSQVSTLHEMYQYVLSDMEIEAAEKLNKILGGTNGGTRKK